MTLTLNACMEKPLKGTWHELLSNEVRKGDLKIYFVVGGGVEIQRANNFNIDSWSLKALIMHYISMPIIIVIHIHINQII
jgi:hypothetical protein